MIGLAGDCDEPRLVRVLVLTVAAASASQTPAVVFDQLDNVPDLHQLPREIRPRDGVDGSP